MYQIQSNPEFLFFFGLRLWEFQKIAIPFAIPRKIGRETHKVYRHEILNLFNQVCLFGC